MRSNVTVGPTGRRRIPHDALIVVCDGERSRFIKNAGTALHPAFEQFDTMEHENPRAGEQATDKPGRFNDGPRVQRSSVAETDRHKLEKVRFAHLLAEVLQRAAYEDAFKDLVLVAPPAVLGELRSQLHPDVQKCVLAEVDKLLTNHPLAAIQRIVLEA